MLENNATLFFVNNASILPDKLKCYMFVYLYISYLILQNTFIRSTRPYHKLYRRIILSFVLLLINYEGNIQNTMSLHLKDESKSRHYLKGQKMYIKFSNFFLV